MHGAAVEVSGGGTGKNMIWRNNNVDFISFTNIYLSYSEKKLWCGDAFAVLLIVADRKYLCGKVGPLIGLGTDIGDIDRLYTSRMSQNRQHMIKGFIIIGKPE